MAKKKIAPGSVAGGPGPTRDKLLNAAESLFIERGYDGTSVSDIAERSKTTKGHLYYYFKNKESLFDAVLERRLASQREALIKAATASGDIRERVHAALDSYVNFIEENPGFPRLVQREICSGSKNVRKISDGMAPVHAWGSGVFAGILPQEGPTSAKHFFFSIYSMTLNYYTYAPMLERLWGADPTSEAALAERRAHLHVMADLVMDKLITGERKAPAAKTKGGGK
ncbi:MAG: TetR family transcriptional regulator [bacterium]